MNGGPVRDLLLFGGSFDPPHRGHMSLLQNAVAASRPDLVVVMPSATSPHKEASQTPWATRAEMCRCFLPVFENLIISDLEERRGGTSYTYDTVCLLEKEYPEARVLLCVGGDMLESFTTWHRWRELLARVTLVVHARHEGEGCDLRCEAGALQSAGGRVLFATGPVVEASSSGIRRRLREGDQSALLLVPPPADAVIRRQGLYRA